MTKVFENTHFQVHMGWFGRCHVFDKLTSRKIRPPRSMTGKVVAAWHVIRKVGVTTPGTIQHADHCLFSMFGNAVLDPHDRDGERFSQISGFDLGLLSCERGRNFAAHQDAVYAQVIAEGEALKRK